jgi:hypothetical protein
LVSTFASSIRVQSNGVRQRCEQRRLHGEGFPDRLHTPTDVTVVVFRHRRGDERVEVIEGGQGGDRDEVAAAEPADLTLHPTLLMGAVDPWQAEERVEQVMGPQGDEPLVDDPLAAHHHPQDRRLEVVVADQPARHPTEVSERERVALQERLLA